MSLAWWGKKSQALELISWGCWLGSTSLHTHPHFCLGVSAEAGTIAGVASALAMALIGAVSSYISYQQKKFCFSIQRKCSRAVASKPSGHGLARGEGQQWGHDSGPFHTLPKTNSWVGFL